MRALALLVLFTLGCAPVVQFTPYKAEYAKGEPKVVMRAVVGYDGDVDTLTAAGGALLGFVRTGNERDVGVIGAHVGGTHVVLSRKETQQFLVGTHCSAYRTLGGGVDASCYPTAVTVVKSHYAVLRVDPSRWGDLPEALRPRSVPAEVSPDCECKAADPEAHRWYLKCPGARPEVSRATVKNLCASEG